MISGKLGLATFLQKINLTHPNSALNMMSRPLIMVGMQHAGVGKRTNL